jgi:hypothetical protein
MPWVPELVSAHVLERVKEKVRRGESGKLVAARIYDDVDPPHSTRYVS